MNIVLATGIYAPEIGGPATYVKELARELQVLGMGVTVITYGEASPERSNAQWPVISVPRGLPIIRWWKYAKALREHAAEADIVYAFSSVSCGVPLHLARLKGPRKVLRLGGDFLWERYTDRGGLLSLRDWYATHPWFKSVMNGLLRTFDHIVFSTAFQEEIYTKNYRRMPFHSVIENAVPGGTPVRHHIHTPFKILYIGRFVAFKNLFSLLEALVDQPKFTLSLVGDGPLQQALHDRIVALNLEQRVHMHPIKQGAAKRELMERHDALVIPSLTEISPNAALEARAVGLPVLLSEETGLSTQMSHGMMIRKLRTPLNIAQALLELQDDYDSASERAALPAPERGWSQVADDHVQLFRSFL